MSLNTKIFLTWRGGLSWVASFYYLAKQVFQGQDMRRSDTRCSRREPGNMPLPDLPGTTGRTGTITGLRCIQSGDIKFEQFACCVTSLVIGGADFVYTSSTQSKEGYQESIMCCKNTVLFYG